MITYSLIIFWATFSYSLGQPRETTAYDLCYICDDSVANTLNISASLSKSQYNLENFYQNEHNSCYKHGAYSVFCYPIPKNSFDKDYLGQDCKTHLSIMPPKKTKDKCDVHILDNNNKLQDILTIYQNLTITSTNSSWYALPKKDASNLYYTIVKRNPSRQKFEESEEGAYSLVFAENKTIHQFLYSRVVFQRRGLHTWTSNFKNDSNPSNVKKTSSSNFTIQPSDGFQGCMDYYNYDITLKHHGFTPTEKYISCIIFNGKPGLCNWKWIKTNGSFTVQLNRTEFNSTRVERYQKYDVGKNDMFGVIRCKLKDHEMMRSVIFDLPFVSVGEKMSAATESIISDSASINPVLLSITSALSALGLLILAFNYQRRKQRIAKMKDRIMRINQFPTNIRPENTCTLSPTHSIHSCTSCVEKTSLHSLIPKWIQDKPELICPPNSIKKIDEIGSGQYGTVYKGMYIHGNARFSVAIKSTRSLSSNTKADVRGNNYDSDSKDNADVDLLIDEAKTMLSIGAYHENIVNLQGIGYEIDQNNKCISQYSIILEYCSKGNVLSYIRENYNEFKKAISHELTSNTRPTTLSLMNTTNEKSLRSASLLVIWSHQIASGMEFLSEKNIYHGDLAARNVLLNDHLVAKVADFGLSRRLYEDFSVNSLFKENSGSMKLPTKWLALETLTYGHIVPGKSDVWSFGVVMWEMFSLGMTPYRPHIDLKTLRTELESGIRLSVPTNCPQNIWTLMHSCWKSDPNSRPSFEQLQSSLWQDIHFPKSSNNFNDLKEEETIYRDILGDTSMRIKYNAICHCNNTAYRKMNKQMGSIKSENPETFDPTSEGPANVEELKAPRKIEAPKRNTIKVFEKDVGSSLNSETKDTIINSQTQRSHCANDTYLIPNNLADVQNNDGSASSLTKIQKRMPMVQGSNLPSDSEEMTMLTKYNTIPLSRHDERKSSLSVPDGSISYETTSKSYEATFFEDDMISYKKTNHSKTDGFQNIEDIFRPLSIFLNSSKSCENMTNNDINRKETKVTIKHWSGNNEDEAPIWKDREDGNETTDTKIYNLLSRQRIRSSTCDTPSTQYTGVDLDDRYAESKYHQTKLLNRMKSLDEVEEYAFIEFDGHGFE